MAFSMSETTGFRTLSESTLESYFPQQYCLGYCDPYADLFSSPRRRSLHFGM